MKNTSFYITKSLQELEHKLLDITGLTQTVFHRKAIDEFINSSYEISQRLLIKNISDPDYVKKDTLERIYLDKEREDKILNIVAELEIEYGKGVNKSVILFQAILDYCCVQAPMLLTPDELKAFNL